MSSNATACSMLVRHACYACSGQHGILSWASSPGCAAFWQIEHCGRLTALGFELLTVAGRWANFMMLPCSVRQHGHQ